MKLLKHFIDNNALKCKKRGEYDASRQEFYC